MKISDIKSTSIKKRFDAESVHFRWHNKNKNGGNFRINLIGIAGKDWEISGQYNQDGIITHLRFGFIYQAGIAMSVNSLEEMFDFMDVIIAKWRRQ